MEPRKNRVERAVARAGKVDFVRRARVRRLALITGSLAIGAGAVAGIVVGFVILSRQDNRPRYSEIPHDSLSSVLASQTADGAFVSADGKAAYAGQIRVQNDYDGLFSSDQLKAVATWIRDDVFRAGEGSAISAIKFTANADATHGYPTSDVTPTVDGTTINVYPDAIDWAQDTVAKALGQTVFKAFGADLQAKAAAFADATDALIADASDTTFPRANGVLDESQPLGRALKNLNVAARSLADWTQADKADFALLVSDLIFRSNHSAITSANGKAVPAPDDVLADRVVVSALVNAPDPSFVNEQGETLASYYAGQGVSFAADAGLAPLAKLADLRATLLTGDSSLLVNGAAVSNTEVNSSSLLVAAKALDAYATSKGAAVRAQLDGLLGLVTSTPAIAKASLLRMAGFAGTNRALTAGSEQLLPLLTGDASALAERLARPAAGARVDAWGNQLYRNVNNPDVLAYAPTDLASLGGRLLDFTWLGSPEIAASFRTELFAGLFAGFSYDLAYRYAGHLVQWSALAGTTEQLGAVYTVPLNQNAYLLPTYYNTQVVNGFYEALGTGNNEFVQNQLKLAVDASTATNVAPLLAFNTAASGLAPFVKPDGTEDQKGLLALVAGENPGGYYDQDDTQVFVTSTYAQGERRYFSYVRELADLINSQLVSGYTDADRVSYTGLGTFMSRRATSFADYAEVAYGYEASPYKEAAKALLSTLAQAVAATPLDRSAVAKAANEVIARVYYDAVGNYMQSVINANRPGFAAGRQLPYTINGVARNADYAQTPLYNVLNKFVNNPPAAGASFDWGAPYAGIPSDAPGISQGGGTKIPLFHGDELLSFANISAATLTLLTYPVGEQTLADGTVVNLPAWPVERTRLLLQALGVDLYQADGSGLSVKGQAVLDFYRKLLGLGVNADGTVDANDVSLVTWLNNARQFQVAGWIRKDESADVLRLVRGEETDDVALFRGSLVQNLRYFAKPYAVAADGAVTRPADAVAADFAGDFEVWVSEEFAAGQYSNVFAAQGETVLSVGTGDSFRDLTTLADTGAFGTVGQSATPRQPSNQPEKQAAAEAAVVDGKAVFRVKVR